MAPMGRHSLAASEDLWKAGCFVALPRVPIVQGRMEWIVSQCAGKKVLHLGCVDSGPLFVSRIRDGELLHTKIAAVASDLWGVDIDLPGIETLAGQGYQNLIVGDICRLEDISQLRGQRFDLIVAAEVLEHLENPGLFLNSVKTLIMPQTTRLIVTVPNAYRYETLVWYLRGIEFVHPDHNFWFSYKTASQLLRSKGFLLKQVVAYSFHDTSLVPRTLRRRVALARDETPLRTGQGQRTQHSGSVMELSSVQRVVRYLRSLPKRLIVNFLYRRTPFFADGMIFDTVLADNGRQ